MSTPILATKLYVPPLQPKVVPRPRLIERLNEGFQRKLTLVSAPAGFGKTALVSDWLHQSKAPTAWLSLDEGDRDPARFLAYLVAALQTMAPTIGEGVLALLQAPQLPPVESILTALLNEITTILDNFVLVLDDYHVIEAKSVDQALTFLIDHLPPQVHMVITTREDPPLPLARLRVRGQMTELRAADLRFTPAEATGFLNQVMDLKLSEEEIAALETRTEGWIAGLQMAALSMQGRADTTNFIQAFTGSHRFVLDYLVEEVLQRQPEPVRSFLLQTSILDRLSGPLCDAVRFGYTGTPDRSEGEASSKGPTITKPEDGRKMLAALERGNLFVVPLDDERQWYRYHHLFADVLQARLMEEQPDQVPALHRRASAWYEQNGLPSDAIRHAFAAADFERAAGLVELAWSAIHGSYQDATWLGWVKALPDELVRARPVLSAGYAWTLLVGGELEAAEVRLQDAERWLDTAADISERSDAPSTEMVVVDEAEFRSLPATIAAARAFQAQAVGDVPGTGKYARQALDLLPEDDYFRRAIPASLLGLAYWASGDLEAAQRSIAAAMANMRMAGNILVAISAASVLADIKMAQGHLHEAASTCEQSLQLATEQGEYVLQIAADLYLGLSELYLEWDDLEAATQQLLRSQELGRQAAPEAYPYRRRIAQARIGEAKGDLDDALDLLDKAERLYTDGVIPNVRPVTALKMRMWVKQGRLTEALGWVLERGLSVDDDLSYLREYEHVTLAKVLLARYKSDRVDGSLREAVGLLERLLKAAEEGGRAGSMIEILVLQALAYQTQGDIPAALAPLERALTLAEPEGYVRIFVDEGPPMAELLTKMKAGGGRQQAYIHKLLAAFGKQTDVHPFDVVQDKLSVRGPQPLVEPLSERELEVLKLLGTYLNGPEIARELMVSLNTMRTHTKNIYNKLGVNNRQAAVRRAEELELL